MFESDCLLLSVTSSHPLINDIKDCFIEFVQDIDDKQSAVVEISVDSSIDFQNIKESASEYNLIKEFVQDIGIDCKL